MQDENALIVIDELDAHIFEYLLAEILKNMSEIAKGQLVFTAHNLSVMEVLDSNSIIITSIKDGDVSYNYFKKVSKTANLRQRYLRSQFMWSEDNINPLELNSSSLRASMRNLVESDKYYSIYKRN
jgi:AAA15 family ATPase/GTPase